MAKFVTIVALCLLGAAVAKGEFNKEAAIKEFLTSADACMKEAGATAADIDDLKGKKPAASMEAKCLRACVMKKFDVMDANGKFVKAVAMQHTEKFTNNDPHMMQVAGEISDACGALAVSDNHCEAAEQYNACFAEQAVAHGLDDIEF